ncbi:MAG TPA: DUF4403 family protein [Gemmatimonadaceae bacterium]|nr:DUF4403 family protein [Gemmatimonadaceae bacterium]
MLRSPRRLSRAGRSPSARRPVARAPLAVVLSLLALASCGGGVHVPPPTVARAAPLPAPEPAVIAIPVTVSLDAIRAQLDSALPPADSLSQARCAALGGALCHQYVYRREPLQVAMRDDRLTVSTRLRYRGRVAAGRLTTLGSCGYAPEPMRRAELRLATSLYWRSDWRLASRNTNLAAELLDACRVTALDVDATPLMRRIVDGQLHELTASVDSLVPAIADLRPAADSLWRAFQRPVALDSGATTWLAMGLEQVSLAPVVGTTGSVRTAVVLTARPRVVLGAAPAVSTRPLPPLTLARPASGLRIPVEVRLPFDDLGRRATALLAPEAAARGITVHGVTLWGAGDTVVVRVDMRGKLDGTVYLLGRLGYDPAARAVRVDDLRYTIESEGVMTRLKTTLGAPLIRRALDGATGHGRLNVGAQLDSARVELTRLLNRPLAPGMLVGGGIRDVRIQGVHLAADAIVVRVLLEGSAMLVVQ